MAKLKVVVVKNPSWGQSGAELLTIGKIYEIEWSDSKSLISCNDGFIRKVDNEIFITLEDFRNNKIDKLLE